MINVEEFKYTIGNEVFIISYNILYAFTAFIALISAFNYDSGRYSTYNYYKDKYLSKILIFLFIVLIGFRSYKVGTDTRNYFYFNWVRNFASESTSEVIFVFIMNVIKSLHLSFTVFLLVISTLFFLAIYKSFILVSKIFQADVFWVLFCFFSLFFAQSLSINVIRQGLALSFLLYALTLWITLKKITIKLGVLCFLAVITHSTSLIPILLYIFVLIFDKRIQMRYYFILYLLGIIVSFLNIGFLDISPALLDILNDGKRAGYLTDTDQIYVTGFKPQFVAFNSIFLVLYYYIYRKFFIKNAAISLTYNQVLKYYLLASFIFFMAFQIPYSDRWGLFSWIVIPILMAPYFTLKESVVYYKIPIVLFFIFIYLFFIIYLT